MKWLKQMFDYRKRWKNQKNRNKRLKKKLNALTTKKIKDMKLEITNDEIKRLRLKVKELEKRIVNLNLEAQRYFDLLMENVGKDSDVK